MSHEPKYIHERADDKYRIWNVEWLLGKVRKAFEFAYTFQRTNGDLSIPWDGPDDLDLSILAGSFEPSEQLSHAILEFQLEDQGRDALDVLLLVTFQLGVTQGIRFERNEHEPLENLLKKTEATLQQNEEE